jgi:hypothetical protein
MKRYERKDRNREYVGGRKNKNDENLIRRRTRKETDGKNVLKDIKRDRKEKLRE